MTAVIGTAFLSKKDNLKNQCASRSVLQKQYGGMVCSTMENKRTKSDHQAEKEWGNLAHHQTPLACIGFLKGSLHQRAARRRSAGRHTAADRAARPKSCCNLKTTGRNWKVAIPHAWGKRLLVEIYVFLSRLQVATLTAGCKHRKRCQVKPFWQTRLYKCLAYVVLAWLSVAHCTKHTKKNKDFVCQRRSNRTAVRETDTESRRDLLKTHTINKGNKRRSQT